MDSCDTSLNKNSRELKDPLVQECFDTPLFPQSKKIPLFNIMVCGASGVGKSSFIKHFMRKSELNSKKGISVQKKATFGRDQQEDDKSFVERLDSNVLG